MTNPSSIQTSRRYDQTTAWQTICHDNITMVCLSKHACRGSILSFEDSTHASERSAGRSIAWSSCSSGVELRRVGGGNAQNVRGKLEQARANATLEKLDEIADYLGLDLLTMVTLVIAAQGDELPSEALQRTAMRISEFEMSGGWQLVEEQFRDGKLIQRSQGKPKQPLNAEYIRALKAQGFNRKTTAEKLGIARSTVQKYWNT